VSKVEPSPIAAKNRFNALVAIMFFEYGGYPDLLREVRREASKALTRMKRPDHVANDIERERLAEIKALPPNPA
jgi:undecaprenyl pyrophosphate synthase